MTAGDQVPTTPLGDVFDKVGIGVFPLQNGGITAKLGTNTGATVIANVVGKLLTHCPGLGVKVYTDVPTVAVLTGGLHVPKIGGTFSELVGKIGGVAPWHIGANKLNNGIILGFTVIVNVAFVAHCPAVGVKVY